jgi:hypothetical protein
MRKEKRIRVGISLFVREDANIWNNGINQNIGLLGQLLTKSPAVEKVYFLNGGDAERMPQALAFDDLDIPLVWPRDVTDELDVVIEMGAILPSEWMRHAHACGVRFCCFGVGHNYNAVAEALAFGKESGIHLTDPSLRVETWGLPQHARTATPMMETLTRKPVIDMPHLWSSFFLDKTMKEQELAGHAVGFKPETVGLAVKRGWRPAILEPNVAVGKNCFIPMLACEHAYRMNPESVEHMMVIGCQSMKDHQSYLRFSLNLDLTQHSKASYEPRVQFANVMGEHRMNCVVTHHIEWGQNYLYYDTLHGGYPLFHNSEYLRDAGVGIYYEGFSAKQAGNAMVDAWDYPHEYWEDYRLKAADYLWTLHPENTENIRIFTDRIIHVANSP